MQEEGVYGAQRLLLSLCAVLAEHCGEHGIQLATASGSAHTGFTLSYSTNIPRQVTYLRCPCQLSSALPCSAFFFSSLTAMLSPQVCSALLCSALFCSAPPSHALPCSASAPAALR